LQSFAARVSNHFPAINARPLRILFLWSQHQIPQQKKPAQIFLRFHLCCENPCRLSELVDSMTTNCYRRLLHFSISNNLCESAIDEKNI